MVTSKQFIGLQGQMNEIFKRVGNGSLEPEVVKRGLQAIIEKKKMPPEFGPSTPNWYVEPEKQLERVRQLNTERNWGFDDDDFPAPPSIQLYGTEVLLLAVYLDAKDGCSEEKRTFEEHRTVIIQQRKGDIQDFAFGRTHGLRESNNALRKFRKRRLVWVAYDYAANLSRENGHIIDDLRKDSSVKQASSEVLTALMLFPEYGSSMDGLRTPPTTLPGYRVSMFGDWDYCLYVRLWERGTRLVEIGPLSTTTRIHDWASPSVRIC